MSSRISSHHSEMKVHVTFTGILLILLFCCISGTAGVYTGNVEIFLTPVIEVFYQSIKRFIQEPYHGVVLSSIVIMYLVIFDLLNCLI